jgi:hypothetical protein
MYWGYCSIGNNFTPCKRGGERSTIEGPVYAAVANARRRAVHGYCCATQRDRLRELCKRTLAFENHYLSIYREYLLAQLRREDEDSRLFAVKRLGETIYADEETIDALQAAGSRGGEELRQAVQETMQKMRSVAI